LLKVEIAWTSVGVGMRTFYTEWKGRLGGWVPTILQYNTHLRSITHLPFNLSSHLLLSSRMKALSKWRYMGNIRIQQLAFPSFRVKAFIEPS
jgi:hypothetical protein